ncbi:MAG: hypothetical protein IH598_17660 [Bacteroidales bacterium]|nr:hypothetical protein [Bacteroidales bacterium]
MDATKWWRKYVFKMSIRNVESRWPRDNNNNLLHIDSLGYSKGDTSNYVLVSYLTKRLFINATNQYAVFVLNNQKVTSYEWSIRKYIFETNQKEDIPLPGPHVSGLFYNIDKTQQNGLFSWTPIEEGRYVISVTLKSGDTTLATLSLDHKVFETLTSEDYINEARSTQVAFGKPDNSEMGLAGIDIVVLNEIAHDLWQYLTYESIYDQNNIIPIEVLVSILFDRIVLSNKNDREFSLRYIGDNWDGIITNEDIMTGLGSRLLGLFKISMVSVAMGNGYITWRNKPDNPKLNGQNVWMPIEQDMHNDFLALTNEQKVDIYNQLRFPKSAIRVVGNLIRRLNIESNTITPPIKIICKHFIRYTSFNVNKDNETFEVEAEFLNVDLPFLSSLFLITNTIENICEDNLQFIEDENGNQIQNVTTPHPINPEVIILKNDLTELGFSMATEEVPIYINTNQDPDPDNTNTNGYFNLYTEWAVKEFQIYSKMKFIAKERENTNSTVPYHQKLRRYPNLIRYTGPVSGVANEETRKLIKLWKALRWRCPVVISAFTGGPNFNNVYTVGPDININYSNIWRHDFLRSRTPRIFVQDFSGYWGKLHNNRVIGNNTNHDLFYDGKMALGTYCRKLINYEGITNFLDGRNPFTWGGNWENNQNNIVAVANANATIDVVRIVILREAGNNFEVINSWDNAFLSLGYFHWTIGTKRRIDWQRNINYYIGDSVIRDNQYYSCVQGHYSNNQNRPPQNRFWQRNFGAYNRGELQGFLTYFKLHFIESFKRCMMFFGLDTYHNRLPDCFMNSQRKYASHFRSQNDSFGWDLANQVRDERADINAGTSPIRQFYGNHNYHRTWHSFYRWVMALRILGNGVDSDFRVAMWDFSRMRLRDLQNTPWGFETNNAWKNILNNGGGEIQNLTFGQVFRAQRTWALLLRWHVNVPENVVNINVSDKIKTIYHFARCNQIATTGNPPVNIDLDIWIRDTRRYLNGVVSNAPGAKLIREDLGNAPAINGDPFHNPAGWPTPTGEGSFGIPDRAREEAFCKAIILYIRKNGGNSLKTSMGIVYNDVADTNQTFVMDTNGLP